VKLPSVSGAHRRACLEYRAESFQDVSASIALVAWLCHDGEQCELVAITPASCASWSRLRVRRGSQNTYPRAKAKALMAVIHAMEFERICAPLRPRGAFAPDGARCGR